MALDFFDRLPPVQPPPSPQELSFYNDLNGLEAIFKFGWLRAREIGNVLWQEQPNRHIQGARIASKWFKHKYVMKRTLPYGHGPAYLLTKKGADFLNEHLNLNATSGKKIGDHIEQNKDGWMPSINWEHDLIANSFLTLCLGGGYQVMSELELRRKFPKEKKIPDGIYLTENGWCGIEVERSNKWGPDLRSLKRSIIDASNGNLILGGSFNINHISLVYVDPKTVTKKDRYCHDHFGRVRRSIQNALRKGQMVHLTAFLVKLRGGAVVETTDVLHDKLDYRFDTHYYRSVLDQKWIKNDDGSMYLEWDTDVPFSLEVSLRKENEWHLSIDEGVVPSEQKSHDFRFFADSIFEVQKKSNDILLGLRGYKIWFYQKWASNDSDN